MIINIKGFILVFLTSIFLLSCSQKNNNIDLDLSNLPKPKKIKDDSLKKDSSIENNQSFIKELVSFEAKENLLSEFKFGKKDPFSTGENQLDQFSSDFKLTGFLNTNEKNYVFVSYLGNEGRISEDSIGGSNTNLLPNGAKVVDIDYKKKKLKINFDNEVYVFEF